MDQEFVSKALEANLAETRYRDIYIPDDHLEFIRLSEGYYGINKRANDCITEYHHPLINRKFVVEELREILITDYWFYTRDNIEQNCYKIPIGMLRELLQPTLAPELQRQAIQTLLEFINLIMSKKVSHSAIAYQCLDLLDDSFDRCSESFILSSKFFPKFLSSASEHKQLTALCLSVTSRVLHSTYTYWKETSDVNHLIESKSGLFSPYREKINMNIGEPYFNELFDRLSRTTAWTDGINACSMW